MHPTLVHRLLVGTVSAVGLVLAGCGASSSTGGQAPQGGGTSEQQPTQPLSGKVTLTLDQPHYRASDAITVTITNGLPSSIWAANHETSCTVLSVERQQDGQWQQVGRCRLMIATRIVAIPPTHTPVTVKAAGIGAAEGWVPGIYRVRLAYRGSENAASGPAVVVYSAEFSIA